MSTYLEDVNHILFLLCNYEQNDLMWSIYWKHQVVHVYDTKTCGLIAAAGKHASLRLAMYYIVYKVP